MPNRIRSSTFKTNSNEFPVEDFFNHVFDSLHDYSIFTMDTNLIINSWNSGATGIFQYEPNEILQSHFDTIFTEADKINGAPALEINTALESGKAFGNRMHVRKDGSTFYAQGQVFPIRSVNGEVIGFVKILRDLTESKRSEESINKYIVDLEELVAHKDNILAIVSHDLRSPLARMISITDYLLSEFESIDPADVMQLLKHLNKSVKDELNMLDYLVEWARIKFASEAFTPSTIDIYQYLLKALETSQVNALAKQVLLENNISANTFVYADGKMLYSIIQNILSNAIKHSSSGGVVLVSSYTEDNAVVVVIKDNGCGMSEDTLQNLFIPKL